MGRVHGLEVEAGAVALKVGILDEVLDGLDDLNVCVARVASA